MADKSRGGPRAALFIVTVIAMLALYYGKAATSEIGQSQMDRLIERARGAGCERPFEQLKLYHENDKRPTSRSANKIEEEITACESAPPGEAERPEVPSSPAETQAPVGGVVPADGEGSSLSPQGRLGPAIGPVEAESPPPP